MSTTMELPWQVLSITQQKILTLPIGRYCYPYWYPILPMRIHVPTGPHQETNCWLSRLGDTVILIETLFSQWGYMYMYQQALIRKPIVDYPDWDILLSWLIPYSPNEDTCTNRPSSGNQLLTIPIGRYCYPYWYPILPMRMSSWPQRGKHWFVNNYVSATKQD